ncbi:phytoene desaturase family protein [Aeromicrobium wangtongii]|uniref:phytoene desaturase family protein n=1 Tax=Aeromicrobium wangtongii TaxID=2969247 RepID=UPI002016DA2C|nr:FAD-dependent oxidoreductase [Aeromicrobium wangtongii]MCL3818453.1 FAD-dependent oxidoreductase [Aeromicrobium wangtongii]
MANVVVVGGGFAGLSAAARLAKLRHEVILLESSSRLGGRLHSHEADGHRWPLELDTVTLPGVFRDLFRKSGRPIDRVMGLEKTSGRRHLFADRSVLDLPLGNRGDQHEAVAGLFGQDEWSPWVDRFAEPWNLIRKMALDEVFPGRPAVTRPVRKTLRPRRTVAALDRDFADERLASIVLDPFRLGGQDRRTTPAFLAVTHYLERSFGRWRFEGGLPGLAAALEKRLTERRVTVELGESGVEIVRDGNRVTGVVTDRRTVPADVVVWCAPTRPASLPRVRMLPVIPASRTLVTLSPDAPAIADDLLVHSDPPMRLFAAGEDRWTIEHHSGEDPLEALARLGLDLRRHVTARTTLTPSELVTLGHWGWAWNGWTTAFELPGVAPTGGLYFAGAHAHPGGTLEAIGMATAAIAGDVGAVPR